MNKELVQKEDYSRFFNDKFAEPELLIRMPCGRSEKVTLQLVDSLQTYVVLVNSVSVEDPGHTFEQCVKDDHDSNSLPKVISWMTKKQVESFIIEVPFFRIDNFKARMAVKFKLSRSGKYTMSSYYQHAYKVWVEIPFGSYSGGGRSGVLTELLDEVSAYIEDRTSRRELDYVGDHIRCRTDRQARDHRTDWMLLQAKLMRNRKFWNVWTVTHMGYCLLCYANMAELPVEPRSHTPADPVTASIVATVLGDPRFTTVHNHALSPLCPICDTEHTLENHNHTNHTSVAKALYAGKLPEVSSDFDPTKPIDWALLDEINGPGRVAAQNPAWKAKVRK